jgi:hypothetical protein
VEIVLRRPKRSKIEVVAPKDEEESVSPLLNYVLKRFVLAILGYFIQNYKEKANSAPNILNESDSIRRFLNHRA